MLAAARDTTGLETDDRASPLAPLAPLVLARVWASSVARGELQRDLSPLLDGVTANLEQKAAIDAALDSLERAGLVSHEGRGRWRLAETAGLRVNDLLKAGSGAPGEWSSIRSVRLVALALGLAPLSAQRARALARPDGLRAAILQKTFDLPRKAIVSAAKLRSQLAVVALQRAFGNTMKDALGAGDGLSPKAGRLLAAQLARDPRDFGTDMRLVAALAAEAVGATRPDIEGLRLAVLRRWVAGLVGHPLSPLPVNQPAVARKLPRAPLDDRRADRSDTAKDAAPPPASAPTAAIAAQPRSQPAAATRPDLAGFAAAVQRAAKARAHGWPGNYKAYVSDVWQAIAAAHPEWGVSEIEFKGMLAEAHRTGYVRLVNADLKDRAALADIQRSAIVYKNTVWHLVRVED